MADVLDADKGYIDNDGAPLIPRRPAYLDVIEDLAAKAHSEIRAMADAAYHAAGFSQEFVNRSRAQRARFERERRIKQGVTS